MRLAAPRRHRRRERPGSNVLPERLGLPHLGSLVLCVCAGDRRVWLWAVPAVLSAVFPPSRRTLTDPGRPRTVDRDADGCPSAALLAEVLIDRSSPKRIMLLTNTARVAGFLGFLFVHDLLGADRGCFLVAVSDRLFWVAHLALVAELAGSGGRDRWFGHHGPTVRGAWRWRAARRSGRQRPRNFRLSDARHR